MLRNYFVIAWRHLKKSTSYSAINIFGLSIGLGFTLLIAGYVWGELEVNKHLRHADRQYIIQSKWKDPNMGMELTTAGPLAKALREQYPDLVANYYRWDGVTSTVSKGDHIFREGVQIGDSTLLTMFGFKLLYGNAATALTEPFSVVITEEKALKFFGRKDVLNETLAIENFSGGKHDFKVTGVMEMPAENSVIHLTPENDNQFFIPKASISFFNRTLDDWNDMYRVGYIELQQGVDPADLVRPMKDLLARNAPPQAVANLEPFLVPLKTYYLGQFDGLVRKMLYTVSLIAVFILLMAVVNFVNIAIGNSATRIREIGLRKVLGSRQRQLVFQFLTESVLLVSVSMLGAIGVYGAGRSLFAGILGKPVPPLTAFHPAVILVLLCVVLFIGILAGIYPAFVLARLKATESVKGKLQSVQASVLLRKTLVGFQICSASLVFIGVMVTMKQVSHFFGRDLGYNKEGILSVQTPRDWSLNGTQQMLTVRNELAALPEVSGVSLSYSVPNGMSAGSTPAFTQEMDSTRAVAMETVMADERYADVFQLRMRAGRFFGGLSDSLGIVVNEAAAKAMGYANVADLVGKPAFLPGRVGVNVIGVVGDFHFGSMKESIRPLVFLNVGMAPIYRLMAVKISSGNLVQSVESVRKKWAMLLPGAAFEYTFMDDALRRLYASEIRLQKAAQLALGLSLVIVLLGISGLISLNVQKRTKEIGIRKVVGASALHILSLFWKDFLPVVLIGGLVSIPIAWLLMQGWLNDYAYRVNIGYPPFLIAVVGMLVLAALVIALQTFRIAADKPVKSLRTE